MTNDARSRKDAFYRIHALRLGLPEDRLRPWFDEELEGRRHGDEPFEVPDKMEVFHKYSYGGQSRFFRTIFHEGKLLGSKCPSCGRVACPPRAACPRCWRDTEWVELPGTGTVEAFTVQRHSTSAFATRVPFLVAYVRLDGTDFRMMTNVEMDDLSRARAGMRVEVRYRKERSGTITDLYFVPCET